MSLTIRSLLGSILLASLTGATAAAATLPGYTVTDLGPGDARLATDSAGQGVVISPFGTSYAFPMTDHSSANPQTAIAALPALTNAPVWDPMTYGNPRNAFSQYASNVLQNDSGVLVVTNIYGVSGHTASAGSAVLAFQRQADGSYSPLGSLWSSSGNGVSPTYGTVATAIGLNNQGQVLGLTSGGSYWAQYNDYVLHDLKTGVTTRLQDLLPTNTNWVITKAVALDDQGRILVTASYAPWNNQGADMPSFPESLLLTPNALPVPEPTALATLVAGVVGFGLFRRRRHG